MAGLLWIDETRLRRSWDEWLKASGGDRVFTMDKMIRLLRDEEAEGLTSGGWDRLQVAEQLVNKWAREAVTDGTD